MSKRKSIFNIIFLLVVFIITIYSVLKGEDIEKLLEIMKGANPLWLLLGVLAVVVFIWCESIIIYYLMNTLGISLKRWKCFLVSCAGFFFSCITPSASGGQPMQIYLMNKEKVSVPVSTLVLMIVTIIYKMVLVVIGLALLIFGQGFVHTYLEDILPVFYLGIGLNVACVAFMIVLAFHMKLASGILISGMRLLERLHLLKHKPQREEKLAHSMEQYHGTARFLQKHMGVMIRVFFITLFQRFLLFLATYFVYRSFGLSGADMWTVVLLQGVISVSVDMLPLPGGMGISEKLFLIIFVPVFGEQFLLAGMLLSRGLGYYVQLLVSAVMTVAAYFLLGRERTHLKKKRGVQS